MSKADIYVGSLRAYEERSKTLDVLFDEIDDLAPIVSRFTGLTRRILEWVVDHDIVEFRNADVVHGLDVDDVSASVSLRRLAAGGYIEKLGRGSWRVV